jgi:hypothetical protein
MSFWCDFYVGDVNQIVASVCDDFYPGQPGAPDLIPDEPPFPKFVVAHANLPSIVSDPEEQVANSPDRLTRLVCEVIGVPPIRFADEKVERVVGGRDPEEVDEEYGLDRLSPRWTELFATLTEEQIAIVASRWQDDLAVEFGEPRDPSDPGQIGAVRDVVVLCRAALERGLPVLFNSTM